MRPPRHRPYAELSALGVAAALYCYSGYAMAASFSVATGGGGAQRRAAMLWLAGVAISLLAALLCLGLALRQRSQRRAAGA